MTTPVTLLEHQGAHVLAMDNILNGFSFAMDSSVPGAGKTFTTACLCQRREFRHLVVICPASVENTWREVASTYSLPLRLVTSFEGLRGTGRAPRLCHSLLVRTDPDIQAGAPVFESTAIFRGMVREGVLLVADEFQRLKNRSTQRSAFEALTVPVCEAFATNRAAARSRCILLSGSPFDKPEHALHLLHMFATRYQRLFVMNRRHLELRGAKDVLQMARAIDEEGTKAVLRRRPIVANNIRDVCYELYVRVIQGGVSAAMPPPAIPVTIHCANGFFTLSAEDADAMQGGVEALGRAAQFDPITGEVRMGPKTNWGALTTALVVIESAKTQLFIRLARAALEASPSAKVVVAVNYLATLRAVVEALDAWKPIVLTGSTSRSHRTTLIAEFGEDNDRRRLMVGVSTVLSVGIDLDDKYGDRPRRAFASPSYLAVSMHQLSRRFHRSLTKSAPVVVWVYGLPPDPVGDPMLPHAQRTCETAILQALARKTRVLQDTLPAQAAAGVVFPGRYPAYVDPPTHFLPRE